MYYEKTPTTKAVLSRTVVELICIILITYPLLHMYVFVQGDIEATHRGFFCDDESLKHPYMKDKISNRLCFFIWAIVMLSIVPAIEILHCAVFPRQGGLPFPFGKVPRFILEVYRTMGYCFIGGLFTLVVTEMTKHQIGRLRPYFLTVCQPNTSLSDSCTDKSEYQVFVSNYTCDGDEMLVGEARKSFVSGHSSFSFYCATFLIIYLQTRLNHHPRTIRSTTTNRKLKVAMRLVKILQPFAQFGTFVLATYISLTRITDYKHHPTDVLAGSVLGVVVAITVGIFLLNLRQYPSIFFQRIWVEEEDDGDFVDGNVSRKQQRQQTEELCSSKI